MSIGSIQVKAVLTDAGGQTVAISFNSLPTTGHAVRVFYADGVSANPIVAPTIADNQGVGNVYDKDVADTETSTGQMAAIFSCKSIGATSGTFTITITHNGASNNYSLIAIQELDQAIILDKTASTKTSSGGVTTLTGPALSSSDENIATAYTEDSSDSLGTISADGSYTNAMNEHNTSAHIGASGDYKNVSVSTAPQVVYTSTNGGFVDAVAVMATYMPAATTKAWINVSNLHPGQSPGYAPYSARFFMPTFWAPAPAVVTFDPALMAAMVKSWTDPIISPPQSIPGGMTPPDNLPS